MYLSLLVTSNKDALILVFNATIEVQGVMDMLGRREEQLDEKSPRGEG